jgi:hypothetical protein
MLCFLKSWLFSTNPPKPHRLGKLKEAWRNTVLKYSINAICLLQEGVAKGKCTHLFSHIIKPKDWKQENRQLHCSHSAKILILPFNCSDMYSLVNSLDILENLWNFLIIGKTP